MAWILQLICFASCLHWLMSLDDIKIQHCSWVPFPQHETISCPRTNYHFQRLGIYLKSSFYLAVSQTICHPNIQLCPSKIPKCHDWSNKMCSETVESVKLNNQHPKMSKQISSHLKIFSLPRSFQLSLSQVPTPTAPTATPPSAQPPTQQTPCVSTKADAVYDNSSRATSTN